MKACTIEGCEKGGKLTRGMCNTHYTRWRKHGDPLFTQTYYGNPEAAFLARTEPLVWSGCIVWTGMLDAGGYAQLRVNGRMVPAHRYSWERENGPIPDGLFVDHQCHERSCVNAEHLRLATRKQNGANRRGPNRGRDLPRGVYRNRKGYQAQVRHNNVLHHLGTFPTIEAASEAVATKRSILFGVFAGGN